MMKSNAKGCCPEHIEAAKVRKCGTEGCETMVKGRNNKMYCESCKKKRRYESSKKWAAASKHSVIYEQVEVMKPVQRKQPKIVKTSAQVHKELKQEDERLSKVYTGLNKDMLAQRLLRGAVF
jgi:hypothetical protein